MTDKRRLLIAPSLLSADFSRLAAEIRQVEAAGADMLHLDIMDGHFVPNLTFGPLVVAAVRRLTKLPLDCHLMIRAPERYIEAFAQAGADYITVHAEATPHLHRALQAIAAAGAVPGIALNPATPPEAVVDVLAAAGLLLVMTVNPGFGGQEFIPAMVGKLERAAELCARTPGKPLLAVDGGINATTAPQVVQAGAQVLVAGSFIFGSPDPREALNTLRAAAQVD